MKSIVKRNKLKERAFTLIELLLAMAVLGGLVTLIIVKYPASVKRTRDVQRQNDLKTYQNALELYAMKHGGVYPTALTPTPIEGLCSTLGMDGSACKVDPKGGAYYYQSNVSGTDYSAWCDFEAKNLSNVVCSNGKAGMVSNDYSGSAGICPSFVIEGYPTATPTPFGAPTSAPTTAVTAAPTAVPTSVPTAVPTTAPTAIPPIPTLTPTTTPTIITYTFYPTDDTYVDFSTPTTSYSTSTLLQVDDGVISYVKFNLSLLSGKTVTSAKLMLYVSNAADDTKNINYTQTSDWVGSSTNYNNRPSMGSLITTFIKTSTGSIQIDLKSAVQNKAGTILSLGFYSSSSQGLDFHSKEYSTVSQRPQILVSYY